MTDTTDTSAANIREFTVSELSAALKHTVEDAFSYVRVRGEISGFKRAASGHLYLSLKDEKNVLDTVCWRGVAGKLNFAPEDGLEVVCTGRLSTYGPRSKYQLVVETMEPAGAGALMALLEERRKKLAAEGLFDAERKREIPWLPQIIGVVTSPTGAVIRDILHRLHDRFPSHVLVWPVQVQGETAAEQIARAIAGFNALKAGGAVPRPDLLIVARGGGSLEDLWAFNEEVVVRAAAGSEIPLISAVGHETDTTLIDYAADLRAPTPTAAAEMAVPVRSELMLTIADLQARLGRALTRLIGEWRNRIAGLARALPRPRDILALAEQRFDELSARLPRGLKALIQHYRHRLAQAGSGLRPAAARRARERGQERLAYQGARLQPALERRLTDHRRRLGAATRLLESLDYRRILKRGYAVIRDEAGAPLTRAAETQAGQAIGIEFADDQVGAVIGAAGKGGTTRKPATKRRPKKPPENKSGDEDQGTLF